MAKEHERLPKAELIELIDWHEKRVASLEKKLHAAEMRAGAVAEELARLRGQAPAAPVWPNRSSWRPSGQ